MDVGMDERTMDGRMYIFEKNCEYSGQPFLPLKLQRLKNREPDQSFKIVQRG